MNLVHIKAAKCPLCDAEVTAEFRRHRHTNGEWNEHRHFACGLRLHYSPNFRRVELELQYVVAEDLWFSSMCKKDPRRVTHEAALNEEVPRIRKLLEKAKMTDVLRARLEEVIDRHESHY